MIGLISGTGFGAFAGVSLEPGRQTECGWPSAAPVQSQLGGVDCLWLPRHGPDAALAPHLINYRANLLALAEAGADRILAINTAGALRLDWPGGTLVVPDQIIDYSWGRASTFLDGGLRPLGHIDFTYPFAEPLRQLLLQAGQANSAPAIVEGGTYACVQGPRLETAAEVRRLIQDGNDMVGMTMMPEAALARELGLDYASLCLVVNPAAGLSDEVLSESEIRSRAAQGMQRAEQLLSSALRATGR